MGRMGYPIFVATPTNPFPKLRQKLPIYRQARKSSGHPDNGGEDVTLALPIYRGRKPRPDSGRLMEPSINHYLQTVAGIYRSAVERSEIAPANVPERVERIRPHDLEKACETMAIFDTPDACVERLQRVRDEFNVGRIICWFNTGGMVPHVQVMRSMELFATQVMPHL